MALLVRVVEPGPKQPLHELEEEVEVLLVRGRAEHNAEPQEEDQLVKCRCALSSTG